MLKFSWNGRETRKSKASKVAHNFQLVSCTLQLQHEERSIYHISLLFPVYSRFMEKLQLIPSNDNFSMACLQIGKEELSNEDRSYNQMRWRLPVFLRRSGLHLWGLAESFPMSWWTFWNSKLPIMLLAMSARPEHIEHFHRMSLASSAILQLTLGSTENVINSGKWRNTWRLAQSTPAGSLQI
jgi:hypothetical protein